MTESGFEPGLCALEESFQIELHDSEAFDVLWLAGNLDVSAVLRLHTEAKRIAAGTNDVVIDWSHAEYISASAIQVLLCLSAVLKRVGRSLTVSSDNPTVRRFLELAGVSDPFPFLEQRL